MAQIFVLGCVEDDLAPKTGSQSGSAYVCFRLTEQVGKGRTQSYQVWAWNEDVSRLDRLGVRKGKMIWLTGTMELVDCTTSQGKAKTMLLKVYLTTLVLFPAAIPAAATHLSPMAPKLRQPRLPRRSWTAAVNPCRSSFLPRPIKEEPYRFFRKTLKPGHGSFFCCKKDKKGSMQNEE